MTEIKEKYQQQILFAEVELDNKSDELPEVTEQVLIDNEHWQEDEAIDNVSDEPLIIKKPRWLWRIVFSIFSVLIIAETVEFFTIGFSQSPLLASLYAVLLLLLTSIGGASLLREYRGLKQFKRRQKLKEAAVDLYQDKSEADPLSLCQQIAEQLPCDMSDQQLSSWQGTQSQELSNNEVLSLFSRQVLSPVDKKALDKISKFSTEAVVLVALSPVAVIDMLLILWRNLKMIEEIANLYGLRLGYWSRVKLVKQVFVNMVYAGATELIADVGAELLGADLLGKLSARLAQGLGAGMLTARLGLKTMHLCRPLPFDENAPQLKDVRKNLISQIKALTSQNVNKG